ncbi:APC family permease [Bacillus subtilis]
MPKLKRSISWLQGTAMAIGAVIGTGVLILPAKTAELAGPASLVSWILISVFVLPIALTLGRLAAKVPDAGGIVAYARKAFGPSIAAITGWVLLGSIPVGVPIIALIGANYVRGTFDLSNWSVTGIAGIILASSLILNARGIKISSSVQILIVSLITLLIIIAVAGASSKVSNSEFHPFAPYGWTPVGLAGVIIFFSFVGWEMIAHLAEEFHNPSRDVPISLGLSAIIISLLYLSVSFVTVGTGSYGNEEGLAPLSILIAKGFGNIAGSLTTILALLIPFGAVHTNIAGFSRMVYAQAREGDFPKIFAKVHSKYRTPIVSLLGLASIFLVVLLYNGFSRPDLGFLIQWPSVIFIVSYMIAMASALKLLSKKDIYWWFALISLIFCTILYGFSGWASIYAPILVILGWIITSRKTSMQKNSSTRKEM